MGIVAIAQQAAASMPVQGSHGEIGPAVVDTDELRLGKKRKRQSSLVPAPDQCDLPHSAGDKVASPVTQPAKHVAANRDAAAD